ncbi:MAG: DNA pilot protein [Microviridae sp.]|nr:MAG: DNA pilot protein [Microviridae sp.]
MGLEKIVDVVGKFNPLQGIFNVGSSALNLIQSAVDAKRQRKNIEMQNAQNTKLADYQYAQEVDRWNKQNAYNSPASQMARFKAAGLNPNLIYSQGNSGNATQIPHYTAPTWAYDYKPAVDLPRALSAYQQSRQQGQNFANTNAQNALIKAQATGANAKGMAAVADYIARWSGDNSIGSQLLYTLLGQNKANLANTQASYALRKQQEAINQMSILFSQAGGPFINPALQALKMVFGK